MNSTTFETKNKAGQVLVNEGEAQKDILSGAQMDPHSGLQGNSQVGAQGDPQPDIQSDSQVDPRVGAQVDAQTGTQDDAQIGSQTAHEEKGSESADDARKAENQKARDAWILEKQKERIDQSNKSTQQKNEEYDRVKAALENLRANGQSAQTWKELEVGHELGKDEKIALITPTTLIVGLDVGKDTHYIRAINKEGIELTKKDILQFNNREEGFEAALRWIENKQIEFGCDRVFVGFEPTGHYWFSACLYLTENGMTTVLVNPNAVHASKELDDNSQEKNDRKDPKVIANLVRDGRFAIPYIPEGNFAVLRNCEELRLTLIENRTRSMNRIHRFVDTYFPEMNDVIGDLDATTNLLVLRNYPLPKDIVEVGAQGLQKLFRDNKLRGVGMKMALKYYHAAEHSIGVNIDPEGARLQIRCLLDELQMWDAQLDQVNARYIEISGSVDNLEKILEIKGIGLCSLLDVLAEIGDPSRFSNAQQVFKLAGLVPVHQESGKYKGKYKVSKRGRKRLRRNVFILTKNVVSKSPEWKQLHEYYTTREKNPLTKMQSLIALSGKLLRVIFTILKTGRTYDPNKLLGDIRRMESKEGTEKAA